MEMKLLTVVSLVFAAVLEVGGDAAVRRGITHVAPVWLVLGAAMLVAYGVVVNTNRSVAFGQLMGVYIAVFFVVSQMISIALLGERLSPTQLAGGALIVSGGVLLQLGLR